MDHHSASDQESSPPPPSLTLAADGLASSQAFPTDASHSTPSFSHGYASVEATPALEAASLPFYSHTSSPRARTYSTTSSVSSFQSSYLDASSPDNSACTSHPPCDLVTTATLTLEQSGQGFVVEEQGVGQIAVHWDQLVQLLVNPQTSASISPDHPIAQASALLASLPAPSLSYGLVPIRLDPANDTVAPLSAGLRGFSLDAAHNGQALEHSQSAEENIYDSPQTAHPFRSTFPSFGSPRLRLPSSELPPLPPTYRSVDPTEVAPFAAYPPPFPSESKPFGEGGTHSLPVPPARLRRGDSDYSSSHSRRDEARNAAFPYTRPHSFYQQAHLSTSSLQDYAGQLPSSSAASFRSLNEPLATYTRPPVEKDKARKRTRGHRALNTHTEVYAWSVHKAQLLPLPADTRDPEAITENGWTDDGEMVTRQMELIVFSPGTYYKVSEDDIEILPSDTTARVNTFLRAQHCVYLCHFRFEGKRPSVIRQHVVSCKARSREIVGPDPLKRLCELQLFAQQAISKQRTHQARRKSRSTRGDEATSQEPFEHPPPLVSNADDSDTGDDRSIYSFDSLASENNLSARRGRRPMSFVGSIASSRSSPPDFSSEMQYPSEAQQTWWSTKPSNSNDAVQALVDASSYAESSESSSVEAVTSLTTAHHQDWLANYGLETPTVRSALEQQQLQQMALDSPSPTLSRAPASSSSFLAMD